MRRAFEPSFLQVPVINKVQDDILAIHTRAWTPPLAPSFLSALARATSGYCGADLSALCSEAALRAVRRRFPQIYEVESKLRIDAEERQTFQALPAR